MARARLGAGILLAVCAASTLAEEAPDDLPRPDAPGSHAAFVERVQEAEDLGYARLLDVYDSYLARQPEDVATAIERCRFIGLAQYDTEEETNRNEEAFEACRVELQLRFPDDPLVLMYRLENLWGDEAIAFSEKLLDRDLSSWPSRQVAELYRRVARDAAQSHRPERAARWALAALNEDDGVDVSLILARAWKAAGRTDDAIRLIERQLALPAETWELAEKADLLRELGAHESALALFERLDEEGQGADPENHARALEAGGQIAPARLKYVEAAEPAWNRREGLTQLLKFDLARSEASTALETYEALRDTGYGADPLLRHRLELALQLPTAGWHLRDLQGLLTLLAMLAALALAPGLWVLPLHYVGLLRWSRNPALPREQRRFGLGHFWYASALLLFVEFLTVYWLGYDQFSQALNQALGDPGEVVWTAPELARLGLASFAMLALGTALTVRRRNLRGFWLGSWSGRRVAWTGLLATVVLWAALFGVVAPFVAWITGQGFEFTTAFSGAKDLTLTSRIIRALGTIYGWPLQVLLVVGIVPAYEEWLFRGLILESCRRHLPFVWSNLVQAAIFALGHETGGQIAFTFCLGLVAGWLVRRSGGLAASWVLHASNNLGALALIRGIPGLA